MLLFAVWEEHNLCQCILRARRGVQESIFAKDSPLERHADKKSPPLIVMTSKTKLTKGYNFRRLSTAENTAAPSENGCNSTRNGQRMP